MFPIVTNIVWTAAGRPAIQRCPQDSTPTRKRFARNPEETVLRRLSMCVVGILVAGLADAAPDVKALGERCRAGNKKACTDLEMLAWTHPTLAMAATEQIGDQALARRCRAVRQSKRGAAGGPGAD